jgi:hypothetical protein
VPGGWRGRSHLIRTQPRLCRREKKKKKAEEKKERAVPLLALDLASGNVSPVSVLTCLYFLSPSHSPLSLSLCFFPRSGTGALRAVPTQAALDSHIGRGVVIPVCLDDPRVKRNCGLLRTPCTRHVSPWRGRRGHSSSPPRRWHLFARALRPTALSPALVVSVASECQRPVTHETSLSLFVPWRQVFSLVRYRPVRTVREYWHVGLNTNK